MAGRTDPKSPAQKRDSFRTRLTMAASIPVYVVLAALLCFCWPNFTLLALIPLCFAAHSAGYLISGQKE